MLSDEEKAIEELKNKKADYFMISDLTGKTLLNLIKKQQKEIEKLKENNGYHLGFIDGGIAKRYEYEDKIKAKIEELEKQDRENRMSHNYLVIPVLQSLLEKE